MEARIKAYAKLNLTLNITGKEGGFHTLDSLVTSVDMYDLIVLKKRKDDKITLTMRGQGSESIPYESNNAAKAAELFVGEYSTCGADITVYKNIPMGLGVGGSSADAAGVLAGLSKLYNIDDAIGIKRLCDMTGSDTRYMLSGGYARLFGRGNEVKRIESDLSLDFLLLAPEARVDTSKCYQKFDLCGKVGGSSDNAERALRSGDKRALAKEISNALYSAAKILAPEVEEEFNALKSFDPLAVSMTGSGSGVFALFENAEFCEYAKSRYRGKAKVYRLKSKVLKNKF